MGSGINMWCEKRFVCEYYGIAARPNYFKIKLLPYLVFGRWYHPSEKRERSD